VTSNVTRFDDSAPLLLGATLVRPLRPGDAGVADIAGMSISEVLEREADGARLAIGNKSPGSAAPMIALLGPDGTARWTLVVPSDPLGAMPGGVEIENIAWVGDRAFVAHERMDGGARSSAAVGVDLVSGRRLWETAIPDDGPLTSLVAASGRVFVSTWSMLVSLDPETGKILWQGAAFE
jgi:outer membrane protein assembly factor BamB